MSGKDRLRVLHLGKFYAPHKGGMETYLQSLCGEMQEMVDAEVIVAIVAFTRSLAISLAERGIGKNVPLNRPGEPEEVAPSFVFLASDVDRI